MTRHNASPERLAAGWEAYKGFKLSKMATMTDEFALVWINNRTADEFPLDEKIKARAITHYGKLWDYYGETQVRFGRTPYIAQNRLDSLKRELGAQVVQPTPLGYGPSPVVSVVVIGVPGIRERVGKLIADNLTEADGWTSVAVMAGPGGTTVHGWTGPEGAEVEAAHGDRGGVSHG